MKLSRDPLILVIGNEKGGAGKSTLAIHLTIALLRTGLRVGVLDLDIRQQSLARFLANRIRWNERKGLKLALPVQLNVPGASGNSAKDILKQCLAQARDLDVVIIDTPGGVTPLSERIHRLADVIVTPMNDSFVDMDLLCGVDPETFEIGRPSQYAEMVWDARKRRASKAKRKIDWIVVRNRLSMLDAKNKRRVSDGLQKLAKRVAFRIAPGISERVIYRELFPRGLTVLDLDQPGVDTDLTMSHLAARQELRDLVISLKLPILAGEALNF